MSDHQIFFVDPIEADVLGKVIFCDITQIEQLQSDIRKAPGAPDDLNAEDFDERVQVLKGLYLKVTGMEYGTEFC